jgi:hypothetical protein
MKNNLLQQFKRWCLKSAVSVVIFVSVVLLGGALITLALPSPLDEITSQATPSNQLTTGKWDSLVEHVKNQKDELTALSGIVVTNTSNITELSGTVTTLSGTIDTLLNTSSLRTEDGIGIYYTGKVNIGGNKYAIFYRNIDNASSQPAIKECPGMRCRESGTCS